MNSRTLPVHKSCPVNGCDVCQTDWPCARLSNKTRPPSDSELLQFLLDNFRSLRIDGTSEYSLAIGWPFRRASSPRAYVEEAYHRHMARLPE
jgi:hypothetical protein